MPGDKSGYHFRDALRLLFILTQGSASMVAPDTARGFDHVFEGEKRAMALDFLIRYPDYLANDLLELYELEGDPQLLDAVGTIFRDGEPDLRVIYMVRWSFGAFEPLETAVAILEARGLVRAVKVNIGGQDRHDFLVGPGAREFLERAVREQPQLAWYEKQVALALRVWGKSSGSAVKGAQYEHPEYRNTPRGSVIPSIKDRVLERFERLEGAAR